MSRVKTKVSQNIYDSTIGRPNSQEVPESLLSGARLRTFSKLFWYPALFLRSEVV